MPLSKMRGEKLPIFIQFAPNGNILSAVIPNTFSEENSKSKATALNTLLLAYTFTRFGRGLLNNYGNQRGRLYGGRLENFAIFDNYRALYRCNGKTQSYGLSGRLVEIICCLILLTLKMMVRDP